MRLEKLNNEKLNNKKILILGFGKEGWDALCFLRKNWPQSIIGIADRDLGVKRGVRLKNIKWHLGNNYLSAIHHYDVIIKSPGIPIHSRYVKLAYKQGKITSVTEIFFTNTRSTIIGVTGSKGKGTTATLIYQILKNGGMKVNLVGNIGTPPLSFLSSDSTQIFVYELSAQQLYKIKKSPHIAVFLNLFPAHLDFFKNIKEYYESKANIFRWQREEDFLIYDCKNPILRKMVASSLAKKICIDKRKINHRDVGINPLNISHKIFLPNILAAVLVAQIFKIPNNVVKETLEKFRGLPHRVEYIGTFREISFFDDSAATLPEATINTIRHFKKQLGCLILGGFDNKVEFQDLAREIAKIRIPLLILFPETGDKIWRELLKFIGSKREPPKAFLVFSMKDAVKLAYEHTPKGKICLLSPASPSFGLFHNYQERGEIFKALVKEYGQKN